MMYQDELTEIFADRGPRSLRSLFDVDSNYWQETTLELKQTQIKRMLERQPLNYWVDQYKLQYSHTHPHIMEAIGRSINLLNIPEIDESIKLDHDVNSVVSKVLQVIQFNLKLDDEYYYSNLPFCVIDSVFSIGVRYGGVKNVIKNVSFALDIPVAARFINGVRQDELTVTEFLSKVSKWSGEEMASELYKNQQRTSTSNGILKSEATLLFLQVLTQFKVERFADIQNVFNNHEFENAIKAIKGQSSGISLKYFYMLAGNENMVKPDRMIMRFLEGLIGQKVSTDRAQKILYLSASKLSDELKVPINAMLLDNHIWNYQRQL